MNGVIEYNFSKIFHYKEGELKLEIKRDRVMDTEFKKGWMYYLQTDVNNIKKTW